MHSNRWRRVKAVHSNHSKWRRVPLWTARPGIGRKLNRQIRLLSIPSSSSSVAENLLYHRRRHHQKRKYSRQPFRCRPAKWFRSNIEHEHFRTCIRRTSRQRQPKQQFILTSFRCLWPSATKAKRSDGMSQTEVHISDISSDQMQHIVEHKTLATKHTMATTTTTTMTTMMSEVVAIIAKMRLAMLKRNRELITQTFRAGEMTQITIQTSWPNRNECQAFITFTVRTMAITCRQHQRANRLWRQRRQCRDYSGQLSTIIGMQLKMIWHFCVAQRSVNRS